MMKDHLFTAYGDNPDKKATEYFGKDCVLMRVYDWKDDATHYRKLSPESIAALKSCGLDNLIVRT